MELKLARTGLEKKPENITLADIEEEINTKKQKFFYFDKENEHKVLVNLIDYLENLGYSVYFRIVKYGLDENDYMYEVHIL